MKKMILLLTMICVSALNGIENPEAGRYIIWGNIPADIRPIIISYLHIYDDPNEIVKAIKATSETNKELHMMVNKEYGNPEGFRDLMHILAKKFPEIDTETMAEQFGTTVAKEYIRLSKQLVTAVSNNNIDQIKQLIKDGADVNFSDKQKGWTPLFFALEFATNNMGKIPVKPLIQVLLEHGAYPNAQEKEQFGHGDRLPPLVNKLAFQYRGSGARINNEINEIIQLFQGVMNKYGIPDSAWRGY